MSTGDQLLLDAKHSVQKKMPLLSIATDRLSEFFHSKTRQ